MFIPDNRFLQVPGSKRQRNGWDGTYTPRGSPSPSTTSEGTTSSFWPSPTMSQRSNSPIRPIEPTPMDLDLEEVFGGQSISSPPTVMKLPLNETEVCFGMIRCCCDATLVDVTYIQNLYSNASVPYIPLSVRTQSTAKVQISVLLRDYNFVMGIIDGSAEAVLLPLLEKTLLRVQGVALLPLDFSEKQSKGSKTVTSDIFLNVFGRPEFADAVGLFLSDNGLFLQHPKYPEGGYRYQNPHVFSRRFENVITENTITGGLPVLSTVRATDTSVSSAPAEILDFFDNVFKSAVLEEGRADWRITTELLSHQKQGLYFLQRREQGLSSFDTSGTTDDKHICNMKGGLLADHMGLGKTLMILALITSTLDQARAGKVEKNCSTSVQASPVHSGATLIVTPVSTLSNWEEQIAAHVKPDELRYLIYYGKSRPSEPTQLHNYDIIITTYSMIAQEWKSKGGPLHSVDFYRLVLDEAHDIRTAKTHRSQAVCALIAERRWAVTATPLQNDLNDIATLFKFLRYKPLHTKTGFHNHIFAAQTGGKSGMDNLRSAMQAVCLRRTKETIASKLPRRSEQIRFLEFRPDEKQLYEYHKKNLFRINDNDAAALRYLSRLRMICDHGNDLLPAERNSGSSFSESTATCSVCSQPLMPGEGMGCPHRSIRAHAECVELLSGADSSPECEECLASEPRTPGVSPEVPETRFPQYQRPSTKVHALVQAIQNDCSTHYPWPKHVVFSVWTRMLDLIAIALERAGILFCRLDGSMPRTRRDAEMQQFRKDPKRVVFLISLMAGGVGINLTCASRVHIMEPHWNPMVELQALERVHRLGQTRDVVITRYIMRDSFENHMLDLQKKKLELARQALDAGKAQIMKCDVKKEILENLDSILSTESPVAAPAPLRERLSIASLCH